MANYCCNIRTNYFHVKDVSDFENLMNSVWSEDSIDVFRDRDEQGREVVGFGTYGSIWGLTENDAEDGDDASYDDNAVDEICRAYEAFDCDEHVEMWMDAKRGGVEDVPRVTMLVDDAMAIEKMLEDLSDAVSDDWVGKGKFVVSW